MDFDIDKPPLNPEDPDPPDAQKEFIRWHLRLGHLPFKKLRLMALSGRVPRRLATCKSHILSLFVRQGQQKTMVLQG